MKKILFVLLSCLLIIGLCACAEKDGEGKATDTLSDVDSSTSDTSAGENEESSDDVEPEGTTFKINSKQTNIRLLGEREIRDEGYVSCNYPGSGFECKIKCDGGDVSVKATTMGECSFMVYVDGVLQKTADGKDYFTIMGNRLITVEGLSAGEHTLKLVRITDFGVDAKLYSLVFAGEMLKTDGVDEKRVFIEFIGDGVNSTVGGVAFANNVTVTYPYLIAQQMNVDYSITAYNGYGLVETETKIGDMYGAESSGDFTRKADIAVINVGALDVPSADANAFQNAYKTLVKKVKQLNGDKCWIVLVCTNGNDDFRNAVSALYDSLGGEESGYCLIMLPTSVTVPPTESDHKAYAETIAERLGELKDYVNKPITPEQSGTGKSIPMGSDSWEAI